MDLIRIHIISSFGKKSYCLLFIICHFHSLEKAGSSQDISDILEFAVIIGRQIIVASNITVDSATLMEISG